jgi:hypothetical protein
MDTGSREALTLDTAAFSIVTVVLNVGRMRGQ